MKCPHYLGFMVIDASLNMEGDRNKVWMRERRCVNCGGVFDPRTLENRELQRQAKYVWRKQEAGRCLIS